MRVNATGTPLRSPDSPPVPKSTQAPSFGTFYALSAVVIGILFVQIWRE